MNAAAIQVTYVGGIDAVDIVLPSGRHVVMKANEAITMMAKDASALKDHPDFVVAKPAKEKK